MLEIVYCLLFVRFADTVKIKSTRNFLEKSKMNCLESLDKKKYVKYFICAIFCYAVV